MLFSIPDHLLCLEVLFLFSLISSSISSSNTWFTGQVNAVIRKLPFPNFRSAFLMLYQRRLNSLELSDKRREQSRIRSTIHLNSLLVFAFLKLRSCSFLFFKQLLWIQNVKLCTWFKSNSVDRPHYIETFVRNSLASTPLKALRRLKCYQC